MLGFLFVYLKGKREEASKREWSANAEMIEEGVGEKLLKVKDIKYICLKNIPICDFLHHISIQICIWDYDLNELDYMVDVGVYGFWGPVSFKAPQLEIIFFGSLSKATGKVSLRQGHGCYPPLVAWMYVSRFHIASSRGMCVAKLSITSWWDELQSNVKKKRLRFTVCENVVVRDVLKRLLGNEVEMLLPISYSAEDSAENSCCLTMISYRLSKCVKYVYLIW